jgi:hypothetical protein
MRPLLERLLYCEDAVVEYRTGPINIVVLLYTTIDRFGKEVEDSVPWPRDRNPVWNEI